MTLRIEDCRRAVQVRYRLTKEQMVGPDRHRRVARPRQIAMALARDLVPNASTTKIGVAFNRDHTTVVWAIRNIGALEEVDAEIAIELATLRFTLATYAAQKVAWAMESA